VPRPPPAGRDGSDGARPRRPLDRHVPRSPQWPGDGVDLTVRLRGAEATLAAGDGAFGRHRCLRADRTRHGSGVAGGLTTTARRSSQRLGAQRPEDVDRQRHLRRPHRDLGPSTAMTIRSRASSWRRTCQGSAARRWRTRSALRVVQNALITLEDVHVSEENGLQNASSFKEGGPFCRRRGGDLLLRGTREMNTLIVGRAITGISAFT